MEFIISNIFLGVGLAADAFCASLSNGMNEPKMKKTKPPLIGLIFATFQAIMPLIGWFCVRNIVEYFTVLEKYIPLTALILLAIIGGKMLIDGIKNKDESNVKVGIIALFVQGVATSIDALSVGFAFAEYDLIKALSAAMIICVVTFIICVAGVFLGKNFGTKFAGKAQIFGGIILIGIGIKIFFF